MPSMRINLEYCKVIKSFQQASTYLNIDFNISALSGG